MKSSRWIALAAVAIVAAAIIAWVVRPAPSAWRLELIDLPDGSDAPEACQGGIVLVRPTPDGPRLIFKPTDRPERELLRGYADEWLAQPRCDPGGTRVLVLRGSTPGGGDIYIGELAGAIVPLTTGLTTGAATWSHDGATVIFASRLGELLEVSATGGAPTSVARDAGSMSSLAVSRDGQRLLFTREVVQYSIHGGEGANKPRVVLSRSQALHHLRVASPKGEVLLAEGAGQIVVIDTVAGSERLLTAGARPFPSLDGNTVYFRAADDPRQLMAIPIAGGAARSVAKLAGRIVVGSDGPDGQHVMIDEDEHHLVSFRIGESGELTDEGAHWVVPAPSGEWRYWQKPGTALELRVIAPGKPLGSMDCVFNVDSMFNGWLDEHHLAYAHGRAWHILDVRTCTDDKPLITVVDVGDHAGRDAVIAPDGSHWFSARTVTRATRHAVTNFASRPRTQ